MSTAQMPQAIESLQHDEQVWRAWQEKNRKAERLGFEKRVKFGLAVSPIPLAALVYWLLKSL